MNETEAEAPRPNPWKERKYVLAAMALPVVAVGAILYASLGDAEDTPSIEAGAVPTTAAPRFPGSIGGMFTLKEDMPSYESIGGSCEGSGGYADIGEGTQVTVYDASGKVVAVGDLDTGHWSGARYDPRCIFTFMVEDVPKLDLYQLEVGRRGKVAYPYDKLADDSFSVRVGLGE